MAWGQKAGQAPSLPKGTAKWIPAEWTDHTAPGQEWDSVTEKAGWQNIVTGETTETRPDGEILTPITSRYIREKENGLWGPVYQDSTGTIYGTNAQTTGRWGNSQLVGNLVVPITGENAVKRPDGTQWTTELAQKSIAGAYKADRQASEDSDFGDQFGQFLGDYGMPLMAGAMGLGAAGMLGSGVTSLSGAAGAGAAGTAGAAGAGDLAAYGAGEALLGGSSSAGGLAGLEAGLAGGAAGAGAAGTGAAGAGLTGAGLTASGIASVIKDVGSLVGAVTAINSITGDPLGLNEAEDAAKKASENATNQSTAMQAQMAKIAQEQWDYYKTNYQPLELNLIKQAQEAGSPEEFARARGAANADVTGSFDIAKKATENKLQSYGINPGSPAYQAALASGDLAQGASMAGALTNADRTTRNLAYSKAMDVASLGRNIPSQSATMAANAGNLALNGARVADLRGQVANAQSTNDIQNLGYGLNTVSNIAQKWFGTPSSTTAMTPGQVVDNYGYGYKDGAYVARAGLDPQAQADIIVRGAREPRNRTIEGERSSQGVTRRTARMDEERELMSNGLPRLPAKDQPMPLGASFSRKRVFGPHMKSYASGGGVGRMGLEMMGEGGMTRDVSALNHPIDGEGTETSDSIPAVVDGQEPAALSTGEFVVNAAAVDLSGGEILEAINRAGLEKRQQGPVVPNQMPSAGMRSFARGGRVRRMSYAGL